MQAFKRALVTEAEFLGMPETTQKVELLDGEVYRSPSPQWWHQEVLVRLVIALRGWAAGREFTVGIAPSDVRFGPGRILQPDLYVVSGKIDRAHRGPIAQIPVLCVEVLSSDRVHDRVTKRLIYAAAGVQEYWVVEPAGLVERWSGVGLERVDECRGRIEAVALPGLSVDLDGVFAE